MSIIILAQSLKGSGSADIQIDGEFCPPPNKQRRLNAFYKNGKAIKFRKCGKCGIEFGIVPGLLPVNSVFGFMIDGEEKDDLGRDSLICIQAKLTEIQDIIPNLENFLQKSSRTILPEKMKKLKEKIEYERNTLKALIRTALSQIPIIGEL
jgi:hypothetical protein